MAELVVAGTVPEAVLKSAAAGTLSITPGEMLEVLVLLTAHATLGEQARATLATWPETTVREVLAAEDAPGIVVRYFISPASRRDALVPVLIAHPAVSDDALAALAHFADEAFLKTLSQSERVKNSAECLQAVLKNPNAAPNKEKIHELLNRLGSPAAQEIDYAVELFALEHEAEILMHPSKPIELVPDATDVAQPVEEVEPERISTLQRLNRMTVAQRVKIAMLGSKEERSILIRDGSRVVFSAVLASSKLSDAEAETIAGMKNVQEGVLREMARTRKFMKNYNVVRALANNPRCPMNISIGLIKNLIVPDLRALSMNKNVPETVRKVATKNYKEKSAPAGKKAE